MELRAAGDRRATRRSASRARRGVAALRAGLYRPLATDPDRVAYWLRHVRHGVWLSEVSAWAAVGYILLTSTPAHDNPVLLGFGISVILLSPSILLLPLADMMCDHRGPMLFYGWSILDTVIVAVAARLDGGAGSPLFSLLFMTLAYMAVAYPPYGVVAMGGFMTATYLFMVAMPHVTLSALFFAAVMAAYTMICALASANSWAAYDRQLLLIRTQETLAATDPLTGVPNRREFLDRLSGAITAAREGAQTVVCLVDLDGFKGVNDRGGHAAGDAMLKEVTVALRGAVREADTVSRLGGDEFAVLAAVTPAFSGPVLAERIRDAVALVGQGHGVTASVGVADVRPHDDLHELLHRADQAMYAAKTAGGNRVTALVG